MSINVGLIGVGYWGPNLLRNLYALPNCRLKTVCDMSQDRCEFVSKNYPNVHVTSNVNEILNDTDITAVVIATPVKTHFDLSIKCLNAGKHILVEKPMATTIDEIEKIESLAKSNQLIAMSGHTFLFNDAVNFVKDYVQSGELGELRYIYSQRLNLGRIRDDVDALWNLAPHDISIIQYILNDVSPIRISRHGQSYIQNDIDDVTFMNLEYPNKVMANIHVSWLDPQKVRKMTFVGSKKMLIYDDIADHKIAIYDKNIERLKVMHDKMDYDQHNFEINYKYGDVTLPHIKFTEPLKKELIHFFDCITSGKEPISGINHTKNVVTILSHTYSKEYA
ncbi:MAG: Gfo/Idh/MocA family oxidoreductase [Candidatus Margulisiibacteriota bacterium]